MENTNQEMVKAMLQFAEVSANVKSALASAMEESGNVKTSAKSLVERFFNGEYKRAIEFYKSREDWPRNDKGEKVGEKNKEHASHKYLVACNRIRGAFADKKETNYVQALYKALEGAAENGDILFNISENGNTITVTFKGE